MEGDALVSVEQASVQVQGWSVWVRGMNSAATTVSAGSAGLPEKFMRLDVGKSNGVCSPASLHRQLAFGSRRSACARCLQPE